MRLPLRLQLLIAPGLVLFSIVVATTWAATTSAQLAEERIQNEIQAVQKVLSEPPYFPLKLRVLEQIRSFAQVELVLDSPGERLATLPVPPGTITPGIRSFPQERYRIQPLRLPEGHPDADSQLYLLYPESHREELIRGAVMPLVLLGVVATLTAVPLTLALSARLGWHIRATAKHLEKVAAGSREPLLSPWLNDEVRDLSRIANALTQQLSETEAQLRDAERLKVLGQFASGLAHQLRNSIAGARLAIELFQQENQTADAEPLQIALSQLQRIEQQVQGFLRFGTPPSLRPARFDLVSRIEAILRLIEPRSQHLAIRLETNFESAQPVQLWDETQWEFLVHNLLENALDHAGAGGWIRVEFSSEASISRLCVLDSGPGPREEMIPRLFDPLISDRPGGIGMGLAVARQAVEEHGGTIRYDRATGFTRFCASWPHGVPNG
ncbi:MAG: ATP-binding protein [Gemmataceae bacterium]